MSSGGGSGRNKRLEDLQEEVLEQELVDRARLDNELDARKRLQLAGGLRQQLRFQGPGRVSGITRPPPKRARIPPRPTVVVSSSSSSRRQDRGGGGSGNSGGSGPGPGDGGSGGVGCFLPGTLVSLVDGRALAIEAVALGDLVASFDDMGQATERPVVGLHSHARDDGFVTLRSSAGDLRVTRAHRILTPSGFREAGEFRVGDLMLDREGAPLEVEAATWRPGPVTVHNLTVAGDPHYIAGGVRVHNIKHEGGFVKGPVEGGDVVEVIQQGEVVMSRSAVKLVGRQFLESLNRKAKRAGAARRKS